MAGDFMPNAFGVMLNAFGVMLNAFGVMLNAFGVMLSLSKHGLLGRADVRKGWGEVFGRR